MRYLFDYSMDYSFKRMVDQLYLEKFPMICNQYSVVTGTCHCLCKVFSLS